MFPCILCWAVVVRREVSPRAGDRGKRKGKREDIL